MLIQLQQKFRSIADSWIISIIKNILKEDSMFFLKESGVKIMLGEYLDNSKLITVNDDEIE
jgi:protein gp37